MFYCVYNNKYYRMVTRHVRHDTIGWSKRAYLPMLDNKLISQFENGIEMKKK